MKRIFTLLCLATLTGVYLLTANADGRAADGNGANTGAPGEGTCYSSTCHSAGGPYQTLTTIEVFNAGGGTTPLTEYVPGQTYTIKVTVTATSGLVPNAYGFQLVCLKAGNTAAGSWTNPGPLVQYSPLPNGRIYAEQTAPNTSSNFFTTDWVAPSKGTGNVHFYAGGNAVNNNGTSGGDGANKDDLLLMEKKNVGLEEQRLTIQRLNIYPNPVHDILHTRLSASSAGTVQLSIADATGRELEKRPLGASGSEQSLDMDVSYLSPGTYFFLVHTETGLLLHRQQFLKIK